MSDDGGKLLGGLELRICVNSLACVRVKGGISKWFRVVG